MSVTAELLGRVVQTVWSTQLGLELETDERARREPPGALRTVVRFHGGFEGALAQCCSRRLSELAAAAAFRDPQRTVGPLDIRDTLAELAHMTAGNLKSLLPSPCEVSTPIEEKARPLQGAVVAEVGFRLDGEPLTVTLARAGDH
jgi:chemotaxis protein CheX